MILTTAQLTRIRPPAMLDTTAKSATETIGKLLAPTWQLVGGFKRWQAKYASEQGQLIELNAYFSMYPLLSWEDYTTGYLDLLRYRYSLDKAPFLALLQRPHVILGCYCKSPTCCHRTLAAGVLVKIAAAQGLVVSLPAGR